MALKRWLRGLKWLMSLLALALLLLIAAWLASNWNDAAPQPRPAALQLPSPTVRDNRNAFFALAGLRAQANRSDIAASGMQAWRARSEFAALSLPQRTTEAYKSMQGRERAALGEALPGFNGPPVVCDPSHSDCTKAWLAAPEALSSQRESQAVIGRRCDALMEESFEFEELLPVLNGSADAVAPHLAGAHSCSQWLLSGAVLAWSRGDKVRTLSLLTQADRLHRALLGGSKSLISQAVAWALSRNGLRVIAELGIRDASAAPPLETLLAPWPSTTDAARRWMRTEAAFQQAANDELAAECRIGGDLLAGQEGEDAGTSLGAQVGTWLCRHRIGWHPQRQRQAIDQQWLELLAKTDGGLPEALNLLKRDRASQEEVGVLGALAWQNTLGNIVLAVANPAFDDYLARQVDLDLHREAVVLALAAQTAKVEPAQRSVWSEQQALSPMARNRLSWSDGGSSLEGRTWYAPGVAHVAQARRFDIRITWPKAAKP